MDCANVSGWCTRSLRHQIVSAVVIILQPSFQLCCTKAAWLEDYAMYSSQVLYMWLLLLLLLLLQTEHAAAVSQATALMQQTVCQYIYCCGEKAADWQEHGLCVVHICFDFA